MYLCLGGFRAARGRLACETGVSDFGSESSKYVPTEYCCVLNSVQLYIIQRYGNGEGVTSIYDITNCIYHLDSSFLVH